MSALRSASRTTRADADTRPCAAAPTAPCNTLSRETGGAPLVRFPGLRGRALKRRREGQLIGQEHVTQALALKHRSLVVALEHEDYGAMPRGMSTRYQRALTRIADGQSPCFPHCGCRWQEAA